MDSIKNTLAREAADAEAVAEAEERGEVEPRPGQRARRQATDPSQVYSVRIPVDRLEQLRLLAVARGVAPTALMRQFVLERLDLEAGAPGEPTSRPVDLDLVQRRLTKAVQAAVKVEMDAVKLSNVGRVTVVSSSRAGSKSALTGKSQRRRDEGQTSSVHKEDRPSQRR